MAMCNTTTNALPSACSHGLRKTACDLDLTWLIMISQRERGATSITLDRFSFVRCGMQAQLHTNVRFCTQTITYTLHQVRGRCRLCPMFEMNTEK